MNAHFRAINCRCHRKIVSGSRRRDLPHDLSAESATVRREASALVVGQPECVFRPILIADSGGS